MEKIKEFKETMTRRVHTFYCDDCGEEIMTCKEWNDRTFVRPDMSDFNIRHMKLKGEYCDKCAEIRRHKALVELIVNDYLKTVRDIEEVTNYSSEQAQRILAEVEARKALAEVMRYKDGEEE